MPGLLTRYRITNGRHFRLEAHDPRDTGGIRSKDKAGERLASGLDSLRALQEKLYAQGTWALLLIFQAMDAAGKDGAIKHVMSGINPQGCQVYSFKHPSAEELDHDFLWRCTKALPERGRIGIFNRSYYEEVLIIKVHPELVAAQRIPDADPSQEKFWEQRYDDINALERHLTRNGTAIVKFFLNVSPEEQQKRFLERINNPAKHWKFAASDVQEREFWSDYMRAYEECLAATSTKSAPWYVIPADHKWVTRALVAAILTETRARVTHL
jgi:PPK2 family polyphosphate:nucleotide phosphotransferase